MSEDKRELILERLVEIYKGLVPDGNSFRNKLEIPEAKRPALVVLDGDETQDERFNTDGRGRPPEGAEIMAMTPETFLLVAEKGEEVGPVLNEWRAKILKAVVADPTLKTLCKSIRYQGFATALSSGRSMEGQARVHFSFSYVLRVNSL